MSLKTALVSRIAAHLTSEKRLNASRAAAESRRRAEGAPHCVDYFHDVTDPYAHLCLQVLPALADRYDIVLNVHLAAPPEDWAAPERARLEAYARADAARLARRAGLTFNDPGAQPPADQLQRAAERMAAAIDDGTFLAQSASLSEAAWRGQLDAAGSGAQNIRARMQAASARRAQLGHYLGATFHYAGEWYWGIDRLHYLEARLAGLGARKALSPQAAIFEPPSVPSGRGEAAGTPDLHFYLSFRSPYTYISAARAKALADAYGARLRLRYVLPMMMRGLPVPRAKRTYITMDTAREARRLAIPFGRVADPLGKPVERGYSLLPWAIQQGRGFEYCHAFMTGVWSRGIDAGGDTGLRRIVEAAGLDWTAARPQLASEAWREEAEANRAEMMALGVWGVPSFRVGDVMTWGQDRLWVIEDELKRLAASSA